MFDFLNEVLILELKHPYFKFSQSRVFICKTFVYILNKLYMENVYACCLYSSIYIYFYNIKGIASILNHLEILYYIYDYFSFLSNPITTTIEMLLCHVKYASSHRIAI